MKPNTPTIIQLDATIAQRARELAGKGTPLGGRVFGVLHAILTLWNEQRRPGQFHLVYADVAALTGDSEQVICEDVGKLKDLGLIVRLRHGNQYRKSCWQFGKEMVDTPTMTAEAAVEQQQKHEAQRRPQVERAPAPPPVTTATAAPAFDDDTRSEGPANAGDIFADLMQKFEANKKQSSDDSALHIAGPKLQNISNTAMSDKQPSCISTMTNCSPRVPYIYPEFKKSESFLPEGGDGRMILYIKDIDSKNAPFTPAADRADFAVFDHRRYYKARFNLDSPYYPKPFEPREPDAEATFRNTLVDLNREPREWAGNKAGLRLWGYAWAWCMGLNPALVETEWRDFFEVRKVPCNSPTAAFKHHCLQNYETLRMRPEHIEGKVWSCCAKIVSLV